MVSLLDKTRFFSMSFNRQMSEFQGEINRIIKRNKKEKIKQDKSYKGEPQVIENLFKLIKSDPKNHKLLKEIEKAEKDYEAYMKDEPEAPSEEELSQYWESYVQAYCMELENEEL